MRLIHSHPYISALCVACLAIIVGIFSSQNPTPTPTKTSSWTRDGSVWLPWNEGGETIAEKEGVIVQDPPIESSFDYTPIVIPKTNQVVEKNTFDINDYFPSLIPRQQPTTAPYTNPLIEIYNFLPSNLVVTPNKSSLTPAQQEIYDYGNVIGSYIQSYENQHPDAIDTLAEQAKDRANRIKGAAAERIGYAIGDIGRAMLDTPAVPPAIASAHEALAKSYIEVGYKLTLIPKAQTDTDLLKAVNLYNASVDTFIKNYLAIIHFFGAHEIVFSQGDAGSVFMFASGGF